MMDFARGKINYLEDGFLQKNFPDLFRNLKSYRGRWDEFGEELERRCIERTRDISQRKVDYGAILHNVGVAIPFYFFTALVNIVGGLGGGIHKTQEMLDEDLRPYMKPTYKLANSN